MKATRILRTSFLTLYCTLPNLCSTDIQIRQQADVTCPVGSSLCVYFAGGSCVNVTAGDTCCVDGSGTLLRKRLLPTFADDYLQASVLEDSSVAVALLQVDAVRWYFAARHVVEVFISSCGLGLNCRAMRSSCSRGHGYDSTSSPDS